MLRQPPFHHMNMLKSVLRWKKLDLAAWTLAQLASMLLLNIKLKSAIFV